VLTDISSTYLRIVVLTDISSTDLRIVVLTDISSTYLRIVVLTDISSTYLRLVVLTDISSTYLRIVVHTEIIQNALPCLFLISVQLAQEPRQIVHAPMSCSVREHAWIMVGMRLGELLISATVQVA
jgi:hypothetical protein